MSVSTIDPKEAYRTIESGEDVRLIDVRTPGEYKAEHIERSQLTPLDTLDAGAMKDGNGQATFVLCRTGRRATTAAEKLQAAGVNDVRVIEGGLEAWSKAGLPVTRSKGGAISLERQVRIAAGSLVLVGVLLAWLIDPAFIAISAFVGGGLVFAGVTDWCGMAMMLAKLPWNR